MDKPHGIIVFGTNGSGKTTLGRELARILSFKHMGIEDYYFEKSDIPYSIERSRQDCLKLMLDDIKKYRSFVITAVTGDFGEMIPMFYELAVYISAPKELCIKRIKQRSYKKYGNRVCKGGDMYEQELRFFDSVASRTTLSIEQWAEPLTCPIIPIDDTLDWCLNAAKIADLLPRTVINDPQLNVYIADFGTVKGDQCLCAEVEGRIVGAVWVRNRGYGIGTAMMKRMLADLKNNSCKKASLAVQKDNYAVKMYLAVGFRVIDETEEEYIMVYDLQ